MGRTFARQDINIRESVSYDDARTVGATMESGSAHLEDDLNNLRTLRKLDLWADAAGNWHDDIQTYNSKKRGIAKLNEDLDELEEQAFLFRSQVSADVVVTAAQNWEMLVVASSEAPSETAAVGVVDTEGAVVAAHGGTFNTHALSEVAGQGPLRPSNLCLVTDSVTGQPIQSDGRDVFALLQSEIATDGHTFNDVDQRAQLSFVRPNAARDDLEACPVADIAGKTINYSYVRQMHLDNIPKWAWLSGAFLDDAALADVTLDRAIDNQSGVATQTQNVDWDISDDNELAFTSDSGGTDMLKLSPKAAGDEGQVNLKSLDINTVDPVDFDEGLKVDTYGEELNIGVSAGTIESTGANDLHLKGANELFLNDGNKPAGWSIASGIKLSEDAQEWTDFEAAFTEVSLLKAIIQAKTSASRTKGSAAVTSNVTANTNVTGAGGTPNVDTQLPNYNGLTFITDVDVFVNGELMRNGADASANHDVYPGDSPTNGDLKFEFALLGTGSKPDQITVLVNGTPT